MDIVEFFQLSSGKWFSQRTNHHLNEQQTKVGRSDVVLELLDKTDPDVIKLCEQHQINPELALCGARVTWNGFMDGEVSKQAGTTVLVPIADTNQTNAGRLLRYMDSRGRISAAGQYAIGSDEVLTLTTDHNSMQMEERLWFASPNLRLRTTVLKRADGVSTASFCSEIRMGVTPTPEPAATAGNAQ